MSNKVTLQFSTPDSWARPLRQRTIFYDPVHGEMIGCEDDIENDAPEAVTEEEETDTVEMTPEDDSPGYSAPPEFTPVEGPTENIPPPTESSYFPPQPTVAAQQVAQIASRIRDKLDAGEPKVIKAIDTLRFQAPVNPTAKAVLNVVSKIAPQITPPPQTTPLTASARTSGPRLTLSGDVAISGVVSQSIVKILRVALSPAVWTIHGVGTVSKGIGSQLEHLSRKL